MIGQVLRELMDVCPFEFKGAWRVSVRMSMCVCVCV